MMVFGCDLEIGFAAAFSWAGVEGLEQSGSWARSRDDQETDDRYQMKGENPEYNEEGMKVGKVSQKITKFTKTDEPRHSKDS